ncbi:MAG: hypothetical protein ABIP35_06460 [Ginsengibacter sp.]
MKNGQFKHIENKIKEAADNVQPDFNDQAWNRMELLLDREKHKRRFIFWWWFIGSFVIIASLVVYQLMQSPTIKNDEFKKNKIGQLTTKSNNTFRDSVVQSTNKFIKPATKSHLLEHAKILPGKSVKKIKENKSINQFNTPAQIATNEYADTKDELEKNKEENSKPIIASDAVEFETDSIEDKNDKAIAQHDPKNYKIEELNKEAVEKKVPAINKRKSFVSKIYLTLTTGVDVSGVKLFSFSENTPTLKSGFGLGFQLNKKISIETGFYLGAKKYVAGPGDYKYSPGSYWSMVDLNKVDANCFVYEIPLLLHYNILQNPSTRYYAGTGLVSYIMKKEDYKYNYTRYGTELTSEKTYRGNIHLLSSFQFHIGIEKSLTEKLSLLVAPSVTIPMQGIGNGKVKLYSTSLQAGIKYFPFKNNK